MGADIVWAHRWLIAKESKYKDVIHISGRYTKNRKNILDKLNTIEGVNRDEVRLTRIRLSNKSLRVRFNGIITEPFTS